MRVYAVVHRPRKPRNGRGFSRGELKEAGLSLNQALKLGIQVDPRRSTKHDENMKTLKKYLSANEPTSRVTPPKPKASVKKDLKSSKAKA